MPFPYTFPFTFDARNTGYFIEVDWNNDGDFDEPYEDITSDVKIIHFSRGKSDELGKAEVGQATITLKNADNLYSPSYTAGNLYLSLLPKRPIRMLYTDGTTIYNLFYGFLEEIIPHPHLTEQDCIITAVDGLDFLSRHDLSTALYKDTLTGTIHNYILTDAGWSATMRTLDAGQDTVPYWYGQDIKARFAQEEIDDSEQGFSYINGSGYFCFEDRHHRSTITHQTSQATFDDTMANITYSLNPRHIYNIIKAKVTPWELQTIQELWRLEEEPIIPAGATLTWWGDASYSGKSVFVDAWTTPVKTTDYQAWTGSGGTGTDMSASLTIVTTKFAKTIKLQITNGATIPLYLYLLKARGTFYDDQTRVVRKTEDSTSQTAYQKRTLEIDGKYLTSADKAQDFCNYAISKYKNPRAEISLGLVNQDNATLNQILSREISDRITITNTKLGLTAKDYFIDYIEEDISLSRKWHTATYRLADTDNEDFWCLGFSHLRYDTTKPGKQAPTRLAY